MAVPATPPLRRPAPSGGGWRATGGSGANRRKPASDTRRRERSRSRTRPATGRGYEPTSHWTQYAREAPRLVMPMRGP